MSFSDKLFREFKRRSKGDDKFGDELVKTIRACIDSEIDGHEPGSVHGLIQLNLDITHQDPETLAKVTRLVKGVILGIPDENARIQLSNISIGVAIKQDNGEDGDSKDGFCPGCGKAHSPYTGKNKDISDDEPIAEHYHGSVFDFKPD